MLEHVKAQGLDDFFLPLDKRSARGIYFYRINGYNGKIGDFARLQLTVGMLQKVNHLMACVDEEDAVVLSWEKAQVC